MPARLTYDEVVKLVSANNRSDEDTALVTCICYKESRFDPLGKNPHSTAAGLMGVTKTAITDLNRRKIGGYSYGQVYLPDINIQMGTYTLRNFERQLGTVEVALSHYGPPGRYAAEIVHAAAVLRSSADPMQTLRQELGK